MKINQIKIGMRLWSVKKECYGIVVWVGKTGWIRLRNKRGIISARTTGLKTRRPEIPLACRLFEDLDIDDQRRVLKASNYCDLPIHAVMVEMGLSKE